MTSHRKPLKETPILVPSVWSRQHRKWSADNWMKLNAKKCNEMWICCVKEKPKITQLSIELVWSSFRTCLFLQSIGINHSK